MKTLIMLILALSVSTTMAKDKDKDSRLERAVDEISDDLFGHDKDNPGQHGRDNAASKGGNAKGGDKDDGLFGDLFDDDDDDHKGGKKNKGGKGKN